MIIGTVFNDKLAVFYPEIVKSIKLNVNICTLI